MVTTPGFEAFTYRRDAWIDEPGEAHTPLWTEQHGAGAPIDSLRDSVRYDGWERVIAWVQRQIGGGVVARDTFAFDRTGNLKTTAGVEVYDVTTDRLVGRAASGCGANWAYTYDRAGNLTQAVCGSTTWVYGYDALNRLRSVRYNGTLIARYGYDVLGRRIAKRVYASLTGGTVAFTRFVYHGAHVAFETDSAGSIGLRYTYGLATDDVLAIRDAAGNHYYVVQDQLHSVRGLVKRDGTWVRSLRYGPYGAVIDSAGPPVSGWELRYRWTGREYDAETGWYYFRARYYDPAVRRFAQEDPIGYGGGSNVYAYGAGGPLEKRDPSGLRVVNLMAEINGPSLDLAFSDGGGGGEAHVLTVCDGSGRCSSTVVYASLVDLRQSIWEWQGQQQQAAAWGNATEQGTVSAIGLTVTVTTPTGGFTMTVGSYRICCEGYEGQFVTVGSGGGFDVSVGFTTISSTSFDAFRGSSTGGCVGLGVGLGTGSYCSYSNASGETSSLTIGVGVSARGRVPTPSGQAGSTYTFVTPPAPCMDVGCRAGP